MIVKGTKQLGNFKRGVNLYVPKRRSAAAPSGIPASTQIIIVTGSNDFDNTYIKSGTVWYASDREIALVSGFWRIRNSETNQELNNPSSDANYIPTTGWTENGSPYAITITAA